MLRLRLHAAFLFVVNNKILAEKDIDERIDHRSFKERGITEQPTIHEGVTARIMEKECRQNFYSQKTPAAPKDEKLTDGRGN